MKDHFTASELAGFELPELPGSKFGIIKRAAREHWPSRPHAGRGGGVEYPITCLPPAARDELLRRLQSGEEPPPRAAIPNRRASRRTPGTADALIALGAALQELRAATAAVDRAIADVLDPNRRSV